MEEMKTESMRTNPVALFMAFGTKGDVYPIAAIAAAFALDQKQYRVVLLTHSAHKVYHQIISEFTNLPKNTSEFTQKPLQYLVNMQVYLARKNVEYISVSTPPVLSPYKDGDSAVTLNSCFSLEKRKVTRKHRQECISNVEEIFGDCPTLDGDFIAINFFALEGWSLSEAFHIRCIVAAPYVVPYSAPSSFENYFKEQHPLLYQYFQEAPLNMVGWKDVTHWMWPLFTDDWGLWRSVELQLSPWPFTDPVTGLPMWHDRFPSPLLMYGFSKEVVECPSYWPPNVRVCGFWFLPSEWQFSCDRCGEDMHTQREMCPAHSELHYFLKTPALLPPIFIGLNSVGSMGFLKNPEAFLRVLQNVLGITNHRYILFTAGFKPLDVAISKIAADSSSGSNKEPCSDNGVSLFGGRLFCFSGLVAYNWLFPRCGAVVHHGGSGSTAAALQAGIPQIICPFMLDQFYWGERMCWLGVSPEPLKRNHLLPNENDEFSIKEAASILARAVNYALTSKIKRRASEIAERLSLEDGVSEAVKVIKEEIMHSHNTN